MINTVLQLRFAILVVEIQDSAAVSLPHFFFTVTIRSMYVFPHSMATPNPMHQPHLAYAHVRVCAIFFVSISLSSVLYIYMYTCMNVRIMETNCLSHAGLNEKYTQYSKYSCGHTKMLAKIFSSLCPHTYINTYKHIYTYPYLFKTTYLCALEYIHSSKYSYV